MNKHKIFLLLLLFLLSFFQSCLTITKKIKYNKAPELSLYPNKNKILLLTNSDNNYPTILSRISNNFIKNQKLKNNIIYETNTDTQKYHEYHELIKNNNLEAIDHNTYNFLYFFSIDNIKEKNEKGVVSLRIHREKEEDKHFDDSEEKDTINTGNAGKDILLEALNVIFVEIPNEIISNTLSKPQAPPYIDILIESNIYSYSFILNVTLYDLLKNEVVYSDTKMIENKCETYKEPMITKLDKKISKIDVIKHNAPLKEIDISKEIFINGLNFINNLNTKFIPTNIIKEYDFKLIGDDINNKFINYIKKNQFMKAENYIINNIQKIEKLDINESKGMHYYNIGQLYNMKNDFKNCYLYFLKAYEETNDHFYYFRLKDIEETLEKK